MAGIDEAIPRVNFETMQRYHGRKVILCCQISQIDNGTVRVTTSDKGEVTIVGGSSPYEGRFAEVMGTVVGPTNIQELEHTNLSDNFSLDMYNELVKLAHKDAYIGMFST
ncbi:hypothetical protein HYH02_002069 [Chlamydomonas schloesseri]|uniref:Replication factor A protein 3 n=1 Tax=Chlamydomonas schloesseri TaxID=2026947 RepID=A0A836BBU3_9CHLO|nr:hypothetical protein HYH02_002069 [Chlamydomonas schloesseri]|eukprot:KAG2453862.1 hypothetical protein HYH02_002069 [Chlamydomonas schloesseri]